MTYSAMKMITRHDLEDGWRLGAIINTMVLDLIQMVSRDEADVDFTSLHLDINEVEPYPEGGEPLYEVLVKVEERSL